MVKLLLLRVHDIGDMRFVHYDSFHRPWINRHSIAIQFSCQNANPCMRRTIHPNFGNIRTASNMYSMDTRIETTQSVPDKICFLYQIWTESYKTLNVQTFHCATSNTMKLNQIKLTTGANSAVLSSWAASSVAAVVSSAGGVVLASSSDMVLLLMCVFGNGVWFVEQAE